jgi:hypothetical protein
MSLGLYLLAGLFLPLFPLSMAFNALFGRIRSALLRGLMLLLWPQVGLALLPANDAATPAWLVAWALLTSALYGFRALALREVGLWTGFLATSTWALLWIPALAGLGEGVLRTHALGFSVPLLLLALLTAELERRFGAAYAGLYGGLAHTLPRLAGVLVVVVLAVIATPLFPTFFAMLTAIVAATPAAALGLVAVWLLWSWAGARLLQGLVVGPSADGGPSDLSLAATWAYAVVLAALVVAGVSLNGALQ